jgi:hypothetical protein
MAIFLPHRRKHLQAGGGGLQPDPTEPVTDQEAIEATRGIQSQLAQLSSGVYVVIYRGGMLAPYDDLMIKTLAVDGSYDISIVDSYNITGNHSQPAICKTTGRSFVVAYNDVANTQGIVKYFSCDADGANIALVDTLIHTADPATFNSICRIDNTKVMLAYTGPGDDGFVKTFSTTGLILTEENVLEHDTTEAKYNSIKKLGGSNYVLAYSGPDEDGFIKTFDISGGVGVIVETESLEFDLGRCLFCSLDVFDSNYVAVSYKDINNYAVIKTFYIDGNGQNIAVKGVETHDMQNNVYHALVTMDTYNLSLVYTNTNYDGILKTFTCDINYNITFNGEFQYDVYALYNALVKIDSTHCLLAYTDNMTKVKGKALQFQ